MMLVTEKNKQYDLFENFSKFCASFVMFLRVIDRKTNDKAKKIIELFTINNLNIFALILC